MSRVRNPKGKMENSRTNHPKRKGFSNKISRVAAKRAVDNSQLSTPEYKELVRRHSAAMAFIHEQEEAIFNYMIRDLQLLKAGKL